MPSDTTTLRFSLEKNSSGIVIKEPATPDNFSLNSVSRWNEQSGIHLHACAFFTIEILKARYTRQAQKLDRVFPWLFVRLLKRPALALTQKLIKNLESDHGTETEELKFHIFELPNGVPGVIKPGIYVEVSHGDSISDNVTWWQGMDEGLPGIIFGHISIEVYKEMLLPEAIQAIKKHYHGEPEDLETLVSDDIAHLFRHITGQ